MKLQSGNGFLPATISDPSILYFCLGKEDSYIGLEVFTVVTMKNAVFWANYCYSCS
jgi:hypothetical protein